MHNEKFKKYTKKEGKRKATKEILQRLRNLEGDISIISKNIIDINHKTNKILLRLDILNDGGKWKEYWEEDEEDYNDVYECTYHDFEGDCLSLIPGYNTEHDDFDNEEDEEIIENRLKKIESSICSICEVLEKMLSTNKPQENSPDSKNKEPQTKQVRDAFVDSIVVKFDNNIDKIIDKRFKKTLDQVENHKQGKLSKELHRSIQEMMRKIMHGISIQTETHMYENELDLIISGEFEICWENKLKPLIKAFTKLRNNQKRDFKKSQLVVKDFLIENHIVNIMDDMRDGDDIKEEI